MTTMPANKKARSKKKSGKARSGGLVAWLSNGRNASLIVALIIAVGLGMYGVYHIMKGHAYAEFCNYAPSGELCLNRAGGNAWRGTRIIGYPVSSRYENFGMERQTNWCNNGHVSVSMRCPFYNSAIDLRYSNNLVVKLKDYDTLMCLASDPGNPTHGALEDCNASSGNIFVWNDSSGVYGFTENRYWTNVANAPRWLCVSRIYDQVNIDGNFGDNTCMWTGPH